MRVTASPPLPARADPLTRGRLLVLMVLVATAAWVAIEWTRGAEGVTAVWLGNGLVVGILLPRRKSEWARILIASFLAEISARVLHGDPLETSVTLAVASTFEILIVVAGIRRWIPDPATTDRIIALTLAATGSTVTACAISALLPATLLPAGQAHGFWGAWALWFSVHVVGIVMMASLVTVAGRLGARLWGRPDRRVDYAVCHLALLAACSVVFFQTRAPLLFLVFPPLVLLTFRHGFPGSVTGIVVVATASTVAAISGGGPFALAGNSGVLSQILLVQLFVAATCAVSMPIATVLTARRRLARKLKSSEADYRLLADNTRDLVVRIAADGTYSYVSRSVTQLLGWTREEFAKNAGRLLHPDDRAPTTATLQQLFENGGSCTLLLRFRHAHEHYVWIEAVAARVEQTSPGMPAEVVSSGRDVSVRVTTQMALDQTQRRLQAITNTLPALVCYVDREERYTFANAHYERMLGIKPSSLLGKTVRESWGEAAYSLWAPHIEQALAGAGQTFEMEPSDATGGRYLQSHYIPDMAVDGKIQGLHAFTFDISELKTAEAALTRLTRVDPLTGLGNRRQLEERMESAIARARRRRQPLVLIYLDLDRFKEINDTLGHLAGDAVLRAFAERMKSCVYEVDLVARLGGDEFVIVVEDAPDVAATEVIARKILAAMQAPIVVLERSLQVSTSIGIAFCTRPTHMDEVLALADQALYAAKTAGRKGFRVERDDWDHAGRDSGARR